MGGRRQPQNPLCRGTCLVSEDCFVVDLSIGWFIVFINVERAGLEPAPTEVVSDEGGLLEGLYCGYYFL